MKKIIVTLFLTIFVYAYAEVNVSVSIPPQKYVVEKIGGDKVKVNVLVPTGADPHTYNPKIGDVRMLADSKLYFKIGFPFEDSVLPKVAENYKNLKFIDTVEGIATLEHRHDHEDDEDEHDHEDHATHDEHDHEIDPHFWTSPKAMLAIAEKTYKALAEEDPANKKYYEDNYRELVKTVMSYDNKFTNLFESGKANKTFLIYHPALGYFARDYGLHQLEVEKDGKAPKINDLKELIEHAKAEEVNVFISQLQDNPSAVNTVAAELKLTPTRIDMLNSDWQKTMDDIYNAFVGK